MTYRGFQLRLYFGMIDVHQMKKQCSLKDIEIFAAVLSNTGTSTGEFRAKLSPKVICQTTVSPNHFMFPWWPMKTDWFSGTITYTFWDRTRMSVYARRKDARCKNSVVFWLWISFFASGQWKNQLLCHCHSLERNESAIVALIPSANVTFWSLKVCVRQKEGPVDKFPEASFFTSSFTWNSEHKFLPGFFFNSDHKFRFFVRKISQSTVSGMTRRPVGLARFSAPHILEPRHG